MSGGPDSITVRVVGDSGHFSSGGKGSSFLVSAGDSPGFLIDCGQSPFSTLGVDMLGEMKGLVATHSHEDHKRWLTEIALFFRYDVKPPRKLKLYSTETIHDEIRITSQAALERTLSDDLLRIVDVPYEEFVERIVIGPRALYRIDSVSPDGSGGEGRASRVVDSEGAVVRPEKAKVVVDPAGGRARMIFFDEDYGEWIEPENFYHFGARAFYGADENQAVAPESGIAIRPLKAPCWHGPPTISIVLEIPGGTRVALSSDIRFDRPLWRRLAEERRDLVDRCLAVGQPGQDGPAGRISQR